MGESYREAGEKELAMNRIQRENRLPKERVFHSEQKRIGRSRKTAHQKGCEGQGGPKAKAARVTGQGPLQPGCPGKLWDQPDGPLHTSLLLHVFVCA